MPGEEKFLAALKEAILEMDYGKMTSAAKEAMEAKVDPVSAVTKGMSPAMAIIGEKFQQGEYFLPELIVAGDVMKEGVKIINPYMKRQESDAGKRFLIATVEGDNHDIGKSIVGTLLAARGFDLVDLGVNVPTSRILEAVKTHQPAIVGLSALLTMTMPKMADVISALSEANLRDQVKVIIGGTSITPEFARRIGADHGTTDAVEGVEKCLEWLGSVEGR
jgi:corrinoid protein of di/trimethylamine methyltransferase